MKEKYTTHQVANLFNSIARTYDLLNHLLSGGLDFYWRKKAIKFINNLNDKSILDVACGTCDFAIVAAKYGCKSVTGIDIANNMLEIAKRKLIKEKLNNRIYLFKANAEQIPFADYSFDAAIVAFGVRNFSNLQKGLLEMHRVLKNEGKIIILEFSKPKNFFFKHIYFFYFKKILPLIGKLISKNETAYTYLPDTVMQFPEGKEFENILIETGFKDTFYKPMTFGIVTTYVGTKL